PRHADHRAPHSFPTRRSSDLAHKIPFIVKINHNELLTYPNRFDQVLFGTVDEARDMGAVAVGATIYFGSDESTRQIKEVSRAFADRKSTRLNSSHVKTSYAGS